MNWNWINNRAAGAHRRAPLRCDYAKPPQWGGVLLWVLGVIALALSGLTFLWKSQQAPSAFFIRERDHRQALYLAESGIALQLHRIRFFDSISGPAPIGAARQALDSLRFYLDSTLEKPDVAVERNRGFLEIRSNARQGNESVGVRTVFGRALDPKMFRAALTLDNDAPLAPFRTGQIHGAVRLRRPSKGIKSLPWPERLQTSGYAESFAGGKYRVLESQLHALLSAEGGEQGNGDFTSSFPPPLSKKNGLGFPMGEVTLRHDGNGFWEITGPAVIAARGDIRVRGKVFLKDITLLSQQDIYFEEEAQAENSTLFATRHLVLQGHSHFEGLLASGGNLTIRERAVVEGNSVVMQVGGATGDTTMALRLEGEAKVRGFVISTGSPGKVVMQGNQVLITGVILATEAWLSGLVEGCVVANRLRCGGNTNCLGEVRIDREALPADFAQPWDLGTNDRSQTAFQLLSWEAQ